LDLDEGTSGLDLFTHEIAHAFIGGQIVIITAIGGIADTELFRAATPMQDIVPRAQRGETTDVVHVDFARVPGHRFGETKNIGASGAKKIEPQPEIGGELGVVPRKSAHIVTPLVSVGVVRVHDVAVVPIPVPAALTLLALVIFEKPIEFVLEFASRRGRAILGGPQPTEDS